MTNRYVGPGGNNSWAGTSWATRKLTLNGAEDTPVVAGDTIYVAPGVYRETLTADVSGSSGNIITYIGDVNGDHTDGVGGSVIITGSDNDTTRTRDAGITTSWVSYRTWRGLVIDSVQDRGIDATNATNIIIEDCIIKNSWWKGIGLSADNSATGNIVRRCILLNNRKTGISFWDNTVLSCATLIENCVITGSQDACIYITKSYGMTIRNCYLEKSWSGVNVEIALGASNTVTVNNCVIQQCNTAFRAITTGEITENYNLLSANTSDRANTSTGANSVTKRAITAYPPPVLTTFKYWESWFGPSDRSWHRAAAGSSASTDDFYGITRPATDAKRSWGPVQYQGAHIERANPYNGSFAAIHLPDAGIIQLKVPVTAASTKFTVHNWNEADYAGTLPQLIIRQPGQTASTTTQGTSTKDTWLTITVTLTPAALPPYVFVELVSNNTATSGRYGVYFDNLLVSTP